MKYKNLDLSYYLEIIVGLITFVLIILISPKAFIFLALISLRPFILDKEKISNHDDYCKKMVSKQSYFKFLYLEKIFLFDETHNR